MGVVIEQPLAMGKVKEWNAFQEGASGDSEEMSAIGFRKTAVALGDIGGDRGRRSVELIGEEIKTAGECFSQGNDRIGEGDGFLIDAEIFEEEGPDK